MLISLRFLGISELQQGGELEIQGDVSSCFWKVLMMVLGGWVG
jgi:hypothetical protein